MAGGRGCGSTRRRQKQKYLLGTSAGLKFVLQFGHAHCPSSEAGSGGLRESVWREARSCARSAEAETAVEAHLLMHERWNGMWHSVHE